MDDDYCFFRDMNEKELMEYGLLVAVICGSECEHHNTEMCPHYEL